MVVSPLAILLVCIAQCAQVDSSNAAVTNKTFRFSFTPDRAEPRSALANDLALAPHRQRPQDEPQAHFSETPGPPPGTRAGLAAERGSPQDAGSRRSLLPQTIYLGSFKVSDGPDASTAPPTYSCKDTCELLYGNDAHFGEYQGSISDTEVTNTCYGDTWQDSCFNGPNSDTYKVGSTFSGTRAWSTYVSDNNCQQINYCYGDTHFSPPPPSPPPSPPSPPPPFTAITPPSPPLPPGRLVRQPHLLHHFHHHTQLPPNPTPISLEPAITPSIASEASASLAPSTRPPPPLPPPSPPPPKPPSPPPSPPSPPPPPPNPPLPGYPVYSVSFDGGEDYLLLPPLSPIKGISLWIYIDTFQKSFTTYIIDARYSSNPDIDTKADLFMSNSLTGSSWSTLYVDGAMVWLDWSSFFPGRWQHVHLESL
ncbi:hypothetical protein CYMTET_11962, partial [Cymbomonas tetramitiformis]